MLEKPSSRLKHEVHAGVALRGAAGGWGALRESPFAGVTPVLQEGRCISTEIITATSRRLSASHTAASSTWASQFRGAQLCLQEPQRQLHAHSTETRDGESEQRIQMAWQKLSWGVSCLLAGLLMEVSLRKGCVPMWEHLQNTHRQNHGAVWVGKGVSFHCSPSTAWSTTKPCPSVPCLHFNI